MICGLGAVRLPLLFLPDVPPFLFPVDVCRTVGYTMNGETGEKQGMNSLAPFCGVLPWITAPAVVAVLSPQGRRFQKLLIQGRTAQWS